MGASPVPPASSSAGRLCSRRKKLPNGPANSRVSPDLRAIAQVLRHRAAFGDLDQERQARIARARAERVRAALIGSGNGDVHVLAGQEHEIVAVRDLDGETDGAGGEPANVGDRRRVRRGGGLRDIGGGRDLQHQIGFRGSSGRAGSNPARPRRRSGHPRCSRRRRTNRTRTAPCRFRTRRHGSRAEC